MEKREYDNNLQRIMAESGMDVGYLQETPIDDIRRDVIRETGRDIFLEEENSYWKKIYKMFRKAIR